LNGHFRTNSPPVIHETVDGETIVVNLDSGSYYDLNALGSSIFTSLAGGSGVGELAALIAATYGHDEADAARAVEAFVGLLVAEELLTPLPAANGAQPDPPAALPASYAEPVLNKHTDMEELLLLDPVHEVGEAGWPSKA
jgi:hypothetical protein